ncbi:DDE-type integrase/transposase/recombinase [[Clostridium] scindens]|uniref:DDE-type integrase/transposase/recombinase n=2 Tax=Clostridium scindens (strain JCM 10418 / VPI 12708) TaxID=29347 RepID=UPI002E76F761|nr:DDE-type integrase/transposase/recombinase [[Clostridium] scindens]MEE0649358.1 DDE-type integrase/transposase/recombinase [[Clostridium] scindens]
MVNRHYLHPHQTCRCIVGWDIDDTLDTRMVINALKKAFKVAKPVILNSDQGCQFTSSEYINFLKENHIRQSMDGKSRWADNIMIERWFRSFKETMKFSL